MKKILYWMPSIIFNFTELFLVVLVGTKVLNLSLQYVAIILFTFSLGRMAVKEPKHYKSWKLCLIWTTVLFFLMFITANISLPIGMLMAVFAAVVLSKNGDINDTFLFRKTTRFEYLRKFIKENANDPELLILLNNLREHSYDLYEVLKLYLVEKKPYTYMVEELDISEPRIYEKLVRIELIFMYKFNLFVYSE